MKGCTSYEKMSAELNLLPEAKTKSCLVKIRKGDDSPPFLLYCLLLLCAFCLLLQIEKNDNIVAKSELVRVFYLVGIPSQWAHHTELLLGNFQ